jgi:hypothetical protein
LAALFEPLCGAISRRPISTDGAQKVGQKRKAETLDEVGRWYKSVGSLLEVC